MKDYQYAVYEEKGEFYYNPIHQINKPINLGDVINNSTVVLIGTLEEAEKYCDDNESH